MYQYEPPSRGKMTGSSSVIARRMLPTKGEWLMLAGYAVLFHVTHTLAAYWGGAGFFSLWFPPAGLRFALLWSLGARLTVPVTLTEIAVQTAAGVLSFSDPDWATRLISIARPALMYGLAIALIQRLSKRQDSPWTTSPMPLGLAAVLAPVAAALAALPWSILRPDFTGVDNLREVVASISSFATGDLLGVLLLAPPLILMAEVRWGSEKWIVRQVSSGKVFEFLAVLGIAGAFAALLSFLDIADTLTPVLLAACWVGLRFGRTAAWLASVLVAAAVFPMTSSISDVSSKLSIHMSVAAVAIAAYLAASFSTASDRARREIARRDRLLYQADRLKTLRAMSVAIIHEVSQPLSTLVLETRHLRERATQFQDQDLQETAALVERKTDALATMTRRLREFGSRATLESSSASVEHSLADANEILGPEFKAAGVSMDVRGLAGLATVRAVAVELTQVFVNLLRNAAHASKRGDKIEIDFVSDGKWFTVAILNSVEHGSKGAGMGLGLLVSRAILEASGGNLLQRVLPDGRVSTEVTLLREDG